MLALYGKLPTAGDFLTIEVPRPLLRPIEDWLARATAAAREKTEGDWNTAFDAGGTWYFWIGEAILERRIAGVLRPSRDKVGRRFPVMLFASSADPEEMPDAPVLEEGQELYQNLAEELNYLADLPPDEISERLKAAANGARTAPARQNFFWAVAPENGAEAWEAVLPDARFADHVACSAARSYWWQPASDTRPGALLASTGLPDPQVFQWFLTGIGASGFANQEETA